MEGNTMGFVLSTVERIRIRSLTLSSLVDGGEMDGV